LGPRTIKMYILGISCYYHDSAAAILKDGTLIAAADEERFSRKKHDASFPKHAIQFCLRKAGIKAEDLAYVVFYEKPFLKFERIFLNTISYSPKTLSFFRESMKQWFFDKLWIKSHIISELNIDHKKLLFCEHHLSHMASSFFCSPFEKSALLSIDGVGEWTTTSWGVGSGTHIDIKEEIRFPHSIGLLYSAFTVFTGYEANEGEYKLMGLAPYGKPRYVDKINKVFSGKTDGSYSLNLDYFSYQYDIKGIYTKKFEELFGTKNYSPNEILPYYADIAASIQVVVEEQLLNIVNYVYQKTKLDTLCYAGGVALNSKANWLLLNKSKFKQLFIQPSAGDSGGALGAALWGYHTVLGKKQRFIMRHAYYGDSETKEQIQKILDSEHIIYKTAKNEDSLVDQVTEKMKKGKVIGWVQDEFEWGPRALGHRSILADPRTFEMKNIVNSKIKFREAFRPFAPSASYETAENFFSVGSKKSHQPFGFMLYVVPVVKEKRDQLGAITHIDGTARPQFVRKDINPLYHKLIQSFGKKTGIPVILNTSFNLKGEPIVNTTKEAMSTFKRSGIDTLVVGTFIIEKR
jgi:carbamoyltransferase